MLLHILRVVWYMFTAHYLTQLCDCVFCLNLILTLVIAQKHIVRDVVLCHGDDALLPFSFPLVSPCVSSSHEGKPASWQDGSSLAYANWKPEALGTGKNPAPHCAVMMAGDEGIWNFVSCQASNSRVVCKTEASECHTCTALWENTLICFRWQDGDHAHIFCEVKPASGAGEASTF